MKLITLILAFLLTFTCSYSQKKKKKNKGKNDVATWFFASIGGRYGSSTLINNHVASTDGLSLNAFNPSSGFDIDLGVNFPFGVSLMVGYDQVSFMQNYEMFRAEDNISLKSSGTIFLLRVVSENAAYFEVGPKLNNLSADNIAGISSFKNSYTSIAFGMGGNLYWNQNFDISLGLRFNYGFDLTNKGTILFGNESTSVIDTQLRLAFNWHIGYFRQAHCDKHVEFLFF